MKRLYCTLCLTCDHAHTTSCSICGEIKITSCSRDALGHFLKEEEEEEEKEEEEEEEEEYGEFDRFSDWTFAVHLQYSKHIFS